MSSTLTNLTAATTWSGTDLFYALVGGNSRKIAASKFLVAETSSSLAMQDSTTAQTFRVYRTFTDSSNYERLALTSSSGQFEITAETAGTGTDNIGIQLSPVGTGQIEFANAGAVATARIQCTSTSGYSAIDSYNSAGTQTGSFGYAGSATGGSLANRMYMYCNGAIELICRVNSHNHIFGTAGDVGLFTDLAMPAGGSTAARLTFGQNAVGIYIGSGAPTVSAAKGSLYLNFTATTTTTRLYINTDSGTTWANFTASA